MKRKGHKAKESATGRKAPVVVTTENFGDLLVQGAHEAAAIARGKLAPAQVQIVTAHDVDASPPPVFTGAMVKRLRQQLGLSQEVFARAIHSTPSAVRSWEQDQRHPDGPTRRLLEVAAEHPTTVLEKLVPSTKGAPRRRGGTARAQRPMRRVASRQTSTRG